MSSLTTCSGQGVVVQRKKSVCSRILEINPHTSSLCAALSSSVHISPSGPCAAWNILLSTQNGLGEELEEESGMTEDSSLVMGERGGGPGVAGLHPERGGGMGMAIDREGGAEDDRTLSGRGSPSPLQVQKRES